MIAFSPPAFGQIYKFNVSYLHIGGVFRVRFWTYINCSPSILVVAFSVLFWTYIHIFNISYVQTGGSFFPMRFWTYMHLQYWLPLNEWQLFFLYTFGHTRHPVSSFPLTGTISQLLTARPLDTSDAGFSNWKFMSVHFWGENPVGTWKMHVVDRVSHFYPSSAYRPQKPDN